MKKGIFFTMDAIIAAGVILLTVILASSSYISQQSTFHLNYLSQDLIRTLSTLTVEEIDNEYLDSLDPSDVDEDNTVLEQIAEFWAADTEQKREFANKTVSNVTAPWVPDNTGFGVWINNETIYTRDMPIKKSLVLSKKIISGIAKGETTSETRQDPPTLFDPVIFEIRVWQ